MKNIAVLSTMHWFRLWVRGQYESLQPNKSYQSFGHKIEVEQGGSKTMYWHVDNIRDVEGRIFDSFKILHSGRSVSDFNQILDLLKFRNVKEILE